MACDLCGKLGTSLAPVLSIYQTEQVKEVCPTCSGMLDKQLRKVRNFTDRIRNCVMQAFITEKKLK